MDLPATFNPLRETPSDEDLRSAYEQSTVRSVIDSYHGRVDAFAEAIQNAVDAVEKRWRDWSGPLDESIDADSVPRIRIVLDSDENAIHVIDNGVGIDPVSLPALLTPYVSDKRGTATRGHKGVGTTFLAYGHPTFEIHTKIAGMGEAIGYKVQDGRKWAVGDTVTGAPDYTQVGKTHPSLGHYESGTYVRVTLDSTTNLRSVNGVLHNTKEMWAAILRSNTAIGNVQLQIPLDRRPEWAKALVVTVEHRDGQESPTFDFPLPHSSAERARELQWLQNNPSGNREYELIYIERDHKSLEQLLGTVLDDLRNNDDEDSRTLCELFDRYEVAAYASLAYKNTFYEELFRKQIRNPSAQRLSLAPGVGSGILVASVGMPMGSLQAHLSETMLPQERRRYFLLLHFNYRYSPDIGRKTIPQELEPLVKWLEGELLRLLRTQGARLLRDRESSTRPSGVGLINAGEEIRVLTRKVEELEGMHQPTPMQHRVLQRTPEWENEVVLVFTEMLARDELPGYRLRAVPGGSARYDALFDYELAPGDQNAVPKGLQVSDYTLGSGLKFSGLWLEFKQDINGFVENLEAEDGSSSKKYFTHVNVLVTWSVSALSTENYSVEEIDANNKNERHFVGSTHLLLSEGNDHRVEVMELRRVMAEFVSEA